MHEGSMRGKTIFDVGVHGNTIHIMSFGVHSLCHISAYHTFSAVIHCHDHHINWPGQGATRYVETDGEKFIGFLHQVRRLSHHNR